MPTRFPTGLKSNRGSFAERRNGRLRAHERPPIAMWLYFAAKNSKNSEKRTDSAHTSRRCGASAPPSPISCRLRAYSAAWALAAASGNIPSARL